MRVRDRQGIEGLPLKLLIVALLISISFPPVWQTLVYYDSTLTTEEAVEQAAKIRGCAASAFIAGEGNVRRVNVDLHRPMAGKGSSLVLGGFPDSASSHVISVLNDGRQVGTIPLQDPELQIVTMNGQQLSIGIGATTLVLRATALGNSMVIIAGAA